MLGDYATSENSGLRMGKKTNTKRAYTNWTYILGFLLFPTYFECSLLRLGFDEEEETGRAGHILLIPTITFFLLCQKIKIKNT